MPTNALTPTQMDTILHQQFREVEDLGFTAEGGCKIFEKVGKNASTFNRAATAICSNKQLIRDIFKSCTVAVMQLAF